jgi:hypothetical protein
MSIIVREWFVRGQHDERHKLPAPVELRPRARRAAAPPDAEAHVVDLAAAPCSLGVVATIRGGDGDRTVWVSDHIEPWATGAGFVFGSIGMVPVSALPAGKHRRHGESAGHGASSQE